MQFEDLGEIGIAWYRSVTPTPEQEEIAQERLNICETCDRREMSTIFHWWKCDACGCPLHKKIFSPKPGVDACPLSKWPR